VILAAQDVAKFDVENGIILQNNRAEFSYSHTAQLNDQLKYADLKDYFKALNTQLTTVEYDAEKHSITLNIEKRMHPSWTLEDWNKHLLFLHQKAIANPKTN